MNALRANITAIDTHGNLSLISLQAGGIPLTAIIIETAETASWLKTGEEIKALFKENEVIISKDLNPDISIQNRIPCEVRGIESGELLSRLSLQAGDISIVSVITTRAVTKLGIRPGDKVLAMIKTNEIMLSE